ncbi:peptidylprolyl isomerase [Rhodobacter xanthinilyticus]|uniref:Parvulin-like PPIase n=1 Tax=Rhodobacter xanthinilyticus TaxID=1850250 RepID=A0A1D9M8N9_9RHOB|nr:peptidylprolyl isomerase [Rhodobacter xanthinilyticus]AOZ68178.1 peptidylprolyl isomerase [Rhodobacter xanthinilyticus]
MPKLTKILGAATLVLTLAGAAQAEGLKADQVVATVNGKDITLGQMLVVHDSLPAEYLSLPDDVLFNGILEQLIQQTALSEIGEGMMTHRDEIALEVDRRAYLANSVLDFTAKGAATEEKVMEAYKIRYAEAEPSREYHAAHIIVDTKEEAEKIKAEIDGGADFAEEAKKNSKDGAAANGGDLGWFGLKAMVQPFADAIAGMKDGEIAGPVQTEYGWHVIKLYESRLADAPKIEDVRAEIEGDLRQEAVEKRVKDTISAAKVEKMTDGIDPAVLKDATVLGQ